MSSFEQMHARTIDRLGVFVDFVRGDDEPVSGKAYIQKNIEIQDDDGRVVDTTTVITVMDSFVSDYDYEDRIVVTDETSEFLGQVFKLQDVISRNGYKKRIKAYQ